MSKQKPSYYIGTIIEINDQQEYRHDVVVLAYNLKDALSQLRGIAKTWYTEVPRVVEWGEGMLSFDTAGVFVLIPETAEEITPEAFIKRHLIPDPLDEHGLKYERNPRPKGYTAGKIENIKRIVDTCGAFSMDSLGPGRMDEPVINCVEDTAQLAERFYWDGVGTTTYVHEIEVNNDFIKYEDLDAETIDEINSLAEDYEADCIRTEKRIS